MTESVLTFYSGQGCHLCDHARDLVYQAIATTDWQLREVSISDSPLLQQRYGLSIPLLALPDGTEKGWPFTAGQIRRLIQA